MKTRSRILLLLLTLAWFGLVFRALNLHVFPNEKLQKFHSKLYETNITIDARRGDILDRNGEELASSVTRYSLFADPKLIKNKRTVAKKISRKLGIPLRVVRKKIASKKRRFVWIERRLSKGLKEDIDDWNIRGLSFIEESERIYPSGGILGPVLGFLSSDEKGLEGLEGFYNKELHGKSKTARIMRDAKGRPLVGESSFYLERPVGKDLHLTIDKDLQYEFEQMLSQAVTKHDAEKGIGIVLDVHTSEVLAMVSVPSFDPNDPFDFKSMRRRNWAVTGAFEPGSTFKSFTVAAGLDEGLFQPNSKIDCEDGELKIGRHVIGEADSKHSFKTLTVSEVLAKSSNIGTTKIAFKLGDHKLREYIKKFGFGDKTGIDFWGESRGILSEAPWPKIQLSNVSFGHGVSATPLQVANAYAALANGGVLHRPYLVKSIYDRDEGLTKTVTPERIRRVIGEDVSKSLRFMLMAATGSAGTGGSSRVQGYLVAGKTGTAQKVDAVNGGYLRGEYISSFVGFVPAEEPKHVIYVAIDGTKKRYYGSDVAAPVFAQVAGYLLRNKGVNPALISQKEIIPTESKESKIETMNQSFAEPWKTVQPLKGLSLKEVVRRVRGANVKLSVVGQGNVKAVIPSEGEPIPKNRRLQVVLEESE